MSDSLIGKKIGKYQIVEHLGRGGMAEVYKAYQPALDRYVAIKLLHSFLAEDKNFLDRFQREAKAVAQLRHPNIVQLYDFDVADGIYYYMVMEFVDGDTLKDRLEELNVKHQLMPLVEAIRIVREVALALSYAHSHNMVHRDVKPSNVIIDRENRVVLTDFGIAKILGSPQYTASGGMTGTPSYISPEQGLGVPGDARSDIYSLGTMFFQMVTGRLPYEADTPVAIVLKHINDPLPVPSRFNPSLPPDIDRIIFKAMAKNPYDRYQTAEEFIIQLDQVKVGGPFHNSSQSMLAPSMPADLTGETVTIFSPVPPPPPSVPATVTVLTGIVRLSPYVLSPGNVAQSPADLPAMCDADWDRAVDHFARGYITGWLREGVRALRVAHQHGLADDLELMAVRGEAIIQRLKNGDNIACSAGLEEFLELMGAAAPVMDISPQMLLLPAIGVGEAGRPVTFNVSNKGRGYLFGTILSRVPWLKVTPAYFGCKAGECCSVTVTPDLSGLPAGRIRSEAGLEIRSVGGDYRLPVQVDILPSVLEVDDAPLDFGEVGQGEAAQTIFTVGNSGRGYLIGRVRCRVPWLTASPEEFKVPAGDRVQITVRVDSEVLAPGEVAHDWALVVESNGGHAVLGVQMRVLSPRLKFEPAQLDLGIIDLAQPRVQRNVELMVSNAGPGVLSGAVMVENDWLMVEPAAFRCRSGESQRLHLSTAQLRTGDHRQVVRLVSNAGMAEVPALLRVHFSLEPEMVYIPAGEFLRGSKEQDRRASAAEKPQNWIYLTEYWIGKYPVTNAQYAVFVEATGHRAPEHWIEGRPPVGKENHPVVNVSWWDALAYCRWLSEVTGKQYRLPTEAQWEKAARGTDGRLYPWGDRWDKRKCNTAESGERGTTPVGMYSPDGDSPYGCADMAGNVLEWVADWYHSDYYARSSIFQDPCGPSSGAVKGLRGGSWATNRWSARCANRHYGNRKAISPEAGFRCAMA